MRAPPISACNAAVAAWTPRRPPHGDRGQVWFHHTKFYTHTHTNTRCFRIFFPGWGWKWGKGHTRMTHGVCRVAIHITFNGSHARAALYLPVEKRKKEKKKKKEVPQGGTSPSTLTLPSSLSHRAGTVLHTGSTAAPDRPLAWIWPDSPTLTKDPPVKSATWPNGPKDETPSASDEVQNAAG